MIAMQMGGDGIVELLAADCAEVTLNISGNPLSWTETVVRTCRIHELDRTVGSSGIDKD